MDNCFEEESISGALVGVIIAVSSLAGIALLALLIFLGTLATINRYRGWPCTFYNDIYIVICV